MLSHLVKHTKMRSALTANSYSRSLTAFPATNYHFMSKHQSLHTQNNLTSLARPMLAATPLSRFSTMSVEDATYLHDLQERFE
jgi:hypothetical protein